jgi:hypothetical protein
LPQSLIEQLQLGAIDGSSPITDLLRRAKLAAVKLSAGEFATWVDLEMNGYEDHTSLPSYRSVSGIVMFHNPYHGWKPVLGLQGLTRNVFQPIGELFMLVQEKSGFLTIGVPEEFRRKVCDSIGFQCDVQFHVSQIEIAGIVEAVRNNILEWTLNLEQAGIRGEGLSFTPEETKAAQSLFVTNNYHGPIASISQGTNNTIHGVSQMNASATPKEIAEAVAALISEIQATGKALGDAGEATSALVAAQPELKAGRVPFSKIAKGLEALGKFEDLAMKAPEVASRLQHLAQLFGWT